MLVHFGLHWIVGVCLTTQCCACLWHPVYDIKSLVYDIKYVMYYKLWSTTSSGLLQAFWSTISSLAQYYKRLVYYYKLFSLTISLLVYF